MKKNTNTPSDLLIIGAGIMGLMSAYFASEFTDKIVILEKSQLFNKESGSRAITRSIRVDYLEPEYQRLAYEAQTLWLTMEEKAKTNLFIKCGCLNIAKKTITPDLLNTYAKKSFESLGNLHFSPLSFPTQSALGKKYPQFDADFGVLDTKGGFLYVPNIAEFLLTCLKRRGVRILTDTTILSLSENDAAVVAVTNNGTFSATQCIITAGKGTNSLLKNISTNNLTFPITYTRPQRKYYYPTPDLQNQFLPERFPVFAYTDIGIYGHPIFDSQKGAVKIAYFVPAGMKQDSNRIHCVEDFVQQCLPQLQNVPNEEIADTDSGWYDTVIDDDFILGRLPSFNKILIGTGWRGTGFKFAPLIGKILSEMALLGESVYDIGQFNPARFIKNT